jgi:DUF4097 and DUF4098 domain-containing protein YvlB
MLKQFIAYLIVSLSFTFTACGSIHLDLGDDLQLIKEKSFNISSGKELKVDISGGDVKVTSWNKSEVEVEIWGNENAMKKMNFSIEGNDELVKVIAERKSSVTSWFSNIQLKVEVKVPKEFNVDLNTSGSDIKYGGVTGNAVLNTSGGDIWGDKFTGDLDASTSGGDIFLFCSDAKINAETSGGDIKLDCDGVNRGIDLSTSGGDIDIKLPENINASVELSTSGGDVSCSLDMSNIKKLSESKLVGDINGGGEKLYAHTSGGDISLTGK